MFKQQNPAGTMGIMTLVYWQQKRKWCNVVEFTTGGLGWMEVSTKHQILTQLLFAYYFLLTVNISFVHDHDCSPDQLLF